MSLRAAVREFMNAESHFLIGTTEEAKAMAAACAEEAFLKCFKECIAIGVAMGRSQVPVIETSTIVKP